MDHRHLLRHGLCDAVQQILTCAIGRRNGAELVGLQLSFGGPNATVGDATLTLDNGLGMQRTSRDGVVKYGARSLTSGSWFFTEEADIHFGTQLLACFCTNSQTQELMATVARRWDRGVYFLEMCRGVIAGTLDPDKSDFVLSYLPTLSQDQESPIMTPTLDATLADLVRGVLHLTPTKVLRVSAIAEVELDHPSNPTDHSAGLGTGLRGYHPIKLHLVTSGGRHHTVGLPSEEFGRQLFLGLTHAMNPKSQRAERGVLTLPDGEAILKSTITRVYNNLQNKTVLPQFGGFVVIEQGHNRASSLRCISSDDLHQLQAEISRAWQQPGDSTIDGYRVVAVVEDTKVWGAIAELPTDKDC